MGRIQYSKMRKGMDENDDNDDKILHFLQNFMYERASLQGMWEKRISGSSH